MMVNNQALIITLQDTICKALQPVKLHSLIINNYIQLCMQVHELLFLTELGSLLTFPESNSLPELTSRATPILASVLVSGQYQAVSELVKYVTQVPFLLLVYYTYY